MSTLDDRWADIDPDELAAAALEARRQEVAALEGLPTDCPPSR